LLAHQKLSQTTQDTIIFKVYDIDRSIWVEKTIKDSLKTQKVDLVFLPLKNEKTKAILKACASLKIPVVSSYQTELPTDSQLLFYSNSSVDRKLESLVEYFDTITDVELMYIDNKVNTDSSLYRSLKEYQKLGKIKPIKDLTTLVNNCKNKAIFFPFRVENLSLRNFTEIRRNCIEDKENIRIIGLYSWLFYNSMETKIWEEYKLTLLSDYYVDYENDTTKKFLNDFRKTYFAEPDYWSFIGYDDFLYFVSNSLNRELNKPNHSTQCQSLTKGTFMYNIQDLKQPYYNQNLHILKFKDWTFQIQNPCIEIPENNR